MKFRNKTALGALILGVVTLLSACYSDKLEKDENPPVFSGLSDITVYVGDGIAYRNGVSCTDDRDGAIEFTVDTSQVDIQIPGEYVAVYIASDSAGNTARESVRVTVLRPSTSPDELYALIDPVIRKRGLLNAKKEAVCEDLYFYIKSQMTYSGDSDKSDWIADACRGWREGTGDCFTYYAVARGFFERLGFQCITVQRSANVLPSTHYWLLINMGTEVSPAWYHWDVCPHYKEFPLKSCLLTDSELLAYNAKVPGYYSFDMEKYPRTPEN